jgi:GTP pyrophosphokinase
MTLDWAKDHETSIPIDREPLASSEARLLAAVRKYLRPRDVAHVERAIGCLHDVRTRQAELAEPAPVAGNGRTEKVTSSTPAAMPAQIWDLDRGVEYSLAVGVTLAEASHIDAITIAAVLLYQLIERRLLQAGDLRARLGGSFGEQVAHTIESIERFDTLQRPATALRRSAQAEGEGDEGGRERRRARERQREQDVEALRKMFVAMSEDPRVVVIKIADQLRLMRAVSEAADIWRAKAGEPTAHDVPPEQVATTPPWSNAECRMLASETREVFAPLVARLGMARIESELEDLAFAVLEPEDYRWLSEAVAREALERGAYVERVCAILREEMYRIGIQAEVSGRVKHLYSIYKKVRRTGTRDMSVLYDILAFRIIVSTIEECYLVLGHVHDLWKPKDGRIKDFIASPKPNGYQSLHTTVFCLDDRLAEIQIRTRAMHELAEYGVAMHWYYKDVGDVAKARAKPLQSWVQQVKEWQQELAAVGTEGPGNGLGAMPGDMLREQIYVFTPAGDAKELPAGATPLDFAYRVHTDLGNHVAGVRITADDGSGKLVKKLVPLDYELRNGDVIEIIKRNDAHPTRDWLRVAKTKVAQGRILRYLNSQEREQHIEQGRERLDRELRLIGLRKGIEDLEDEDLQWVAQELGYAHPDGLLVAIGTEKLRMGTVLPKLRERLHLTVPPEPEAETPPVVTAPSRETQPEAAVEGMSGMLTNLAHCCNPLPGDELRGFITRGRGVIIHRVDCPNLRHLLAKEPERGVAVGWPKLEGKETFRAPIVVEGNDRTGFLRDVTGVISGHKLNMLKVDVITKPGQGRAIISAVLEIQRPEDLEAVLRDLRAVESVLLAERKKPGSGSSGGNRAR